MRIVKLILAIGFVPVSAFGQNWNGSLDDLKDVCQYQASAKELRVINATALLVANSPQFITYNSSNNTYSISTERFTHRVDDPTPVCTTSRFYNELHVPENSGRTGFLIAPDKIMTAAHAPPESFDANHWLIVFRDSQTTAEDPGCSNFTWTNIPASDVYHPMGAVANTYAVSPEGRYDYAVIQLDRAVTGRMPLKIRRSGRARVGDPLLSVGYPIRGAQKVDSAGVMALVDAPHTDGDPIDGLFRVVYDGNDVPYDTHGFEGSSGSPIYNENDDVVESAMAYGSSATWFTSDDDCEYADQATNTYDTNGPMPDIQDQIPRTEVLVQPLDYVSHILDLNSSPTTFTNHYTVTSASAQGGETVDIGSISGPSGDPPGDPALSLSISPGLYTVPSSGLDFDVIADVSSVQSCGTWDYELNVHDVTNDQENIIRHHFEIGLREYSVAPDDDWVVNDLGSPYSESKTYTIRNVRPTPTHVMVSQDGTLPDSNLILINGSTGSASFNLGPAGSQTDTATVVLTINSTVADAAKVGSVHQGRIAIYNQPFNCSVPSEAWYIYRNLTFTRGEQIFVSPTQPAILATPQNGQEYGDPLTFDIDLSNEPQGMCVADINLYLGLYPLFWDIYFSAPYLEVQLTSPGGRTARFWYGNAIPGPEYVESSTFGDFFGDGTSVPTLYLDDQLSPPLGGDLLSAFNGAYIRGHWSVAVSSSANQNAIVAGPVQLDFTRKALCAGSGN